MSRKSKAMAVGALLVLVTLALYWPATRLGFLELDDDTYVARNPYVQQGLTVQSVAWATTQIHENYWLPATWLSFMADRTLQGASPRGYHRTNVLLHALNALLLYLIALSVTRHVWGSALLAALFAWHPLRLEAVVWITSRKDVLSTAFGLASLACYIRYTRTRLRRWYALAFLTLGLGLSAKPMLVTWPFLFLVLDFWPLRRREQRAEDTGDHNSMETTPARMRSTWAGLVLEKIPLIVLVAGFCAVSVLSHEQSDALHSLEQTGLAHRLATIPLNYAHYLSTTIWPANLAVRYPLVQEVSWLSSLGIGLGLLVITGWLFARRRAWPWFWTGWAWFLGTLVPIIGLLRIGTAPVADRFTYVPFMGLAIMVVGGLHAMQKYPRAQLPIRVGAVLLCLACLGMTFHGLGYWRDGETLFRRALEVAPANFAAHNALGRALENQGRQAEAIKHYRESIRLMPRFAQAHANLGNMMGNMGRPEEAVRHFEAALEAAPRQARIRSNYGVILFQAGQRREGLDQLRQALEMNPNLAHTHFNLGMALRQTGRKDQALHHFREAARIHPGDEQAHAQAGELGLELGRLSEARFHLEKASALNPANQAYRKALEPLNP